MKKRHNFSGHLLRIITLSLAIGQCVRAAEWTVDTQDDWEKATRTQNGMLIEEGVAKASDGQATFSSSIRTFDEKVQPQSLTVSQIDTWLNWEPVGRVIPSNLGDAPVFLAIGPDNYWAFGRYKGERDNKKNAAEPEAAILKGFDIPLLKTSDPHQFDAPGGLKPALGGVSCLAKPRHEKLGTSRSGHRESLPMDHDGRVCGWKGLLLLRFSQ